MDRTVLGKLPADQRTTLVRRVAKAVDLRPGRDHQEARLAAAPRARCRACAGTARPTSRCPVALDVTQAAAQRMLEEPEDFPGVVVDQQSVRAYPQPFGINAAHLLGYLSPITEDELDRAESDGDRSVNGASVVGRAGVEQEYDEWLRGMPGYRKVEVDSMGRTIGDDGEVDGPARRHPGHLHRRQGAVRGREAARPDDRHRPGDPGPGDRAQLRRRLRCRRGPRGRHRAGRRDGQPADVRPVGLGRRHHQEAARRRSTPRRPARRSSVARRRASSRPARPGSRS